MEEKRPGQYFPIFEDEHGSYILNAKDMSMIDHIDDLVDAGITSLKIEGRAKSAYYVSVVTNAYRQAVDQYVADPENYHLAGWLADLSISASKSCGWSKKANRTGTYLALKRAMAICPAAMYGNAILWLWWITVPMAGSMAPSATGSLWGTRWRFSNPVSPLTS